MKVLGFNFTKISVEKYKDSLKDLQIKNEVDITDLIEVKQDIFKSKEGIFAAKFKYNINYSPDIAKIETEGSILVSVEPKLAKDIIKAWKTKTLPEDFRIALVNIVFRKAGLKALELEDEMNLPLHMQMPALRKKQE